MTLGVLAAVGAVAGVERGRGSTRGGSPAPRADRSPPPGAGAGSPRWCRGTTGDSRITVVCGRSRAARARAASPIAVRSGARSAPSGVGAQMTAVRTRPSSAGLVVGRKPAESIRRISAAARARRPGVRLRASRPGADRCRSRWCRCRRLTAAWARGRPRWPSPMTARSAGMAVAVLPLTGVDSGRKPCGQNGRAQCQTRRKYDRYAGLRVRACPGGSPYELSTGGRLVVSDRRHGVRLGAWRM